MTTLADESKASWIASLPPEERQTFLDELSPEELNALSWDWSFWARPKQLAPIGDWLTWVALAGRGFGKTRTGAEWVRGKVERGEARRIALVNDTAADTRDVMIEGPDGILAVCPPWDKPVYEPSKRRVTWPNGAVAIAYAAESPELLRGPQHDLSWCDELAKWKNLRKRDAEGGTAWDNLQMGLRVGDCPQCFVGTTPRPVKLLREIMARPSSVVTTGSSYENRGNLSPAWFEAVISPYEGTRLGRQEIDAEILEDTPGALWTSKLIDEHRVREAPALTRIVIGVDPSASSGDNAAHTGIVAAGIGADGHGYVLDDASIHGTPAVWGSRAVASYHRHTADRIVAEINNGGEMVEFVLRTADKTIPYKAVHAARGKKTRAEPISALYEQGKVHHVGAFADLEDQMTTWVPGDDSPDRMDALVWALTELMLGTSDFGILI